MQTTAHNLPTDVTPNDPRPFGRLRDVARSLWVVLAIATIALALSLALFAKDRYWPPQYHTDEPSKAAQIATGDYNFYQPQLLLRATQALTFMRTGNVRGLEFEGQAQEPQRNKIVYDGRLVSAATGAAAVGVFVLLAALLNPRQRVLSALATAFVLPKLPLLVTHAHHMKEDSGMVLALGCWLSAGTWFLQPRGASAVVMFGLAGGLALSTKWIGLSLTLAALTLVAARGLHVVDARSAKRFTPALLYACVAGVAFRLINLPILSHAGEFINGLRFEAAHVASGNGGLVTSGAWLFYLTELPGEVGGVLFSLAGFYVWSIAKRTEQPRGWWLPPVTACAFFVMIFTAAVRARSMPSPVRRRCRVARCAECGGSRDAGHAMGRIETDECACRFERLDHRANDRWGRSSRHVSALPH